MLVNLSISVDCQLNWGGLIQNITGYKQVITFKNCVINNTEQTKALRSSLELTATVAIKQMLEEYDRTRVGIGRLDYTHSLIVSPSFLWPYLHVNAEPPSTYRMMFKQQTQQI